MILWLFVSLEASCGSLWCACKTSTDLNRPIRKKSFRGAHTAQAATPVCSEFADPKP